MRQWSSSSTAPCCSGVAIPVQGRVIEWCSPSRPTHTLYWLSSCSKTTEWLSSAGMSYNSLQQASLHEKMSISNYWNSAYLCPIGGHRGWTKNTPSAKNLRTKKISICLSDLNISLKIPDCFPVWIILCLTSTSRLSTRKKGLFFVVMV